MRVDGTVGGEGRGRKDKARLVVLVEADVTGATRV